MNEMIERVAGALFDRSAPITKELLFGDPNITWPQVLVGIKEGRIEPSLVWFDEARAMLKAIRDPTDAMLDAGEAGPDPYSFPAFSDYQAEQVWVAMIDAALEEK